MSDCICSLAGTKACDTCNNNGGAEKDDLGGKIYVGQGTTYCRKCGIPTIGVTDANPYCLTCRIADLERQLAEAMDRIEWLQTALEIAYSCCDPDELKEAELKWGKS